MKTSLWLSASVLVFASPSAAFSQTPPDAAAAPESSKSIERGRLHFQRGVDFFKEGNFAAALVEFKRANEIAPNYRILFNLGQTFFELHEYVNSLHAFEDYLASGGADIRAARRTEVEEEIHTLRGRVAALTVRSNLSGSELLIDDSPSGTLPLKGPVLISAGRHTLFVRKNGAVQTSRTVEVSGGDSATVELSAVVPEPPPLVPPSHPPASTVTSSSGMGAAFWVSLACAIVLAAGTATTGILALNSQNELDRKLSIYPGSPADIDSARTKTQQMALVTDIVGGVAVAATAMTIVFALWKPGENRPAASTGLVARIGPGGLVLGF
jgi:hypothetical protein